MRAPSPTASGAGPASRALQLALSGALVLLAALLTACGGDGEDEVKGAGDVRVGSVAQFASCEDWVKANEEQQLATIEDIRSQINLEDSGVEAPALTDEQAMDLFDNACAESYSSSFRLYKLYARADGFQALLPQ